MLRSNLCDITLTKTDGTDFIDLRNRCLAFKNNSPFTNCKSKINNVLTDNAEYLDVVISMYSLLEYGKSFKNNRKFMELLQR